MRSGLRRLLLLSLRLLRAFAYLFGLSELVVALGSVVGERDYLGRLARDVSAGKLLGALLLRTRGQNAYLRVKASARGRWLRCNLCHHGLEGCLVLGPQFHLIRVF